MTLEHTFKNFTFSPRSREIMDNWEAVHECQDERDAERLQKRAALTAQSLALTKLLSKALNLLDADEVDVSPKNNCSAVTKFKILQTICILEQSNWLTSANASKANAFTHPSGTIDEEIPEPSTHTLKHWMQDIKRQESLIAHACRNVQESLQDTPSTAAETEQGLTLQAMYNNEKDQCLPTDAMAVNKANNILSAEDVTNKVGNDFKLNEKQWMAFRIIAQSFVRRYVEGVEWDAEPLRMLMTGPGGTGKTHIVKAVQRVMDHYGCAHKIRFLAPTGSAAALIDGMTIHKGLGIKIKSKEKGKGNRKLGSGIEDYTVVISIQN
jgi:SpoVK/Ycf46/Vps4 family AAA+-type ATPase